MLKLAQALGRAKIYWFLFYILLFGLLLRSSYTYLDPDLGWHLKVGEEIALNQAVPQANIYNYTFTGDWVNHEWLIDWFSFEIYNQFDYLSLSIIFALVIILAFIILRLFIRRLYPNTAPIALAAIFLFGLAASLPSFGVRMQEFSFLFLLLEFGIINAFYYHHKTKPLILLIPLFYLWANIHGSFLFGLSLLILFLLFNLLIKERRNKKLLAFTIFSALAIIGTLLTPYGTELYSFLSGYKDTFYLTAIYEWLPFYYFPVIYLQLSYLGVLSATWLIYLYNLKRGGRLQTIDFWQLLLFLLFLFLALKSRRNFPLAFVATAPFFAHILTEILELQKIKTIFQSRLIRLLTFVCLILVIVSIAASTRANNNPFNSYCHKYPCQAVDFLKVNSQYQEARIFNEYSWGGYLLWTYPDRKIFIDGRLPQVVYGDKTFLEEYAAAFYKDTNREDYFAKHQIDLILLKTKDEDLPVKNWEKIIYNLTPAELTTTNHLRVYLENSPAWQIIHQDATATIYERFEAGL